MAKFCTNCGAKLERGQEKCLSCGKEVNEKVTEETVKVDDKGTNNTTSSQKSKMAAGLLGIFLGALGIHNFYLGNTGKGVAQLLLTLLGWVLCGIGPFVAELWGLIEGILILTGSINTDANGNPLGE